MADPTAPQDGVSLLERLADDARAAPLRPAPPLARVQHRVAVRHRRRRAAAGVGLLLPLLAVGLVWFGAGRPQADRGPIRTEQPELPDGIGGADPDRTTTSEPAAEPDAPLAPVRMTGLDLESESLPPSPLAAREAMASAWTGQELVVWGGSGDEAPGDGTFADGAAYDPAAGTWRLLAPSPLSARARATAAWSGTELYVWGGATAGSGVGGLLDGAAYDPATDTWRTIASAPAGTDRSFGSAVWVGGRLVIGGGSVPTDPATGLLVYDPTTDAWTTVATSGEVATVVAAGDLVAVLLLPTDTYRDAVTAAWFDPASGDLRTGPTLPMDAPIDHLGGVWTGEELVVGATNGGGAPGVVASISPEADDWTAQREIPADQSFSWPRSIGFMPSPDLLVWSGTHAVSFGTGGSQLSWFDPATGEVALAGVSRCGYDGAIAWTGTEVLAWGGQDCRQESGSRQSAEGLRLRPMP